MFQIIVLFGICLSGWFALDHFVIVPALKGRGSSGHSMPARRANVEREVRIYQMYDSGDFEPKPSEKALYDAFGKRFFDYE